MWVTLVSYLALAVLRVGMVRVQEWVAGMYYLGAARSRPDCCESHNNELVSSTVGVKAYPGIDMIGVMPY